MSESKRMIARVCLESLEQRNLMTVTASVNWSASIGNAPAEFYGLNAWSGMDPNVSNQQLYRDRISSMKPGLIRIHSAEQLRDYHQQGGWLDFATLNSDGQPSWNASTVTTVLSHVGYGSSKRILTIAGWPATMDTDNNGLLDTPLDGHSGTADMTQVYARWCAQLVTIVKNAGQHVDYWEPLNENDNRSGSQYDTAAKAVDLANIFKAASSKMHAADTTIETGGGAFRDPYNMAVINSFLANARDYLNYTTFHQYGFGGTQTDNNVIYDRAQATDGGITTFRNAVNANVRVGEDIFLDEFSIYNNYTLDTANQMASLVGGVFDALYIVDAAKTQKVQGLTIWNDQRRHCRLR